MGGRASWMRGSPLRRRERGTWCAANRATIGIFPLRITLLLVIFLHSLCIFFQWKTLGKHAMYVAAHYAVYIATTISYVSCSQLHDLTPSSALAAGRERVAAAEHQGPVDAADRRLHEEAGRGEGAGGAAHPHARGEVADFDTPEGPPDWERFLFLKDFKQRSSIASQSSARQAASSACKPPSSFIVVISTTTCPSDSKRSHCKAGQCNRRRVHRCKILASSHYTYGKDRTACC